MGDQQELVLIRKPNQAVLKGDGFLIPTLDGAEATRLELHRSLLLA